MNSATPAPALSGSQRRGGVGAFGAGGGLALATLVVLLACGTGVLVGAIAGVGSLLFLAPFLALGGALFLFFVPAQTALWMLLLVSILVVGPVIYYAKVDAARWLPPGLALALSIPLVVARLKARPASLPAIGWPPHMVWYGVFIAVLIVSSMLSSPRLAEFVFSLRTYYAYVPLALVLMYGLVSPQAQERMWRFILLCSAIQLPFVLYQVLVVTGYRINRNALQDVVTGTFPGNVEHGGANAGVAVFALTASLVAISLWRAGRLRAWMMAGVSLSCVAVIMLAEVKAVVLMLPVALALLYWRELGRRPLQSLAWLAAGLVTAAAVFVAYERLYYSSVTVDWNVADKPRTPLESIRNQLDPQLAQRGPIVGRMAAYADWWQRTARAEEAAEFIVGYGAGSTQYGRLGIGEVMERLRYNADNTATSLLLWDSGVLGHLALLLVLALAARAAFRLRDAPQAPPAHQAILHAVGVALVVHILCLPYKDFMFRAAPSQVLLFLMLGYVAYWWRVVAQAARAGNAASRRPATPTLRLPRRRRMGW